jgi:hypothetical protein
MTATIANLVKLKGREYRVENGNVYVKTRATNWRGAPIERYLYEGPTKTRVLAEFRRLTDGKG